MFSNFLLKSCVLPPPFFFQSLDNYRFLLPFKPAFSQFRSRFTVSLTSEIMKARLAGSPAAARNSEMPPLSHETFSKRLPFSCFPTHTQLPGSCVARKMQPPLLEASLCSFNKRKKRVSLHLIIFLALWIRVNCEIHRVLLAAEVSEERVCCGILLGKGLVFLLLLLFW